MSEKTKIQQIITDWKKMETESQKEAFLEKIKSEVDAKSAAGLMTGVKAIGELVLDLHEEVMRSSEETTSIKVFPANAEEASLIEALLSRMKVRYRVA